MRAINLFEISRNIDKNVWLLYEKSLSEREKQLSYKKEEVEMLSNLVTLFSNNNLSYDCYDGWFYSFTIPQIGKEFDLLKVSKGKTVINIELKSQEKPLDEIEKQLVLNRYYLSVLTKDVHSYTVVRCLDNTLKVYKYSDSLELTSAEAMIEDIAAITEPITDDIEQYFRPRDYLISPFNSPDSFAEGRYYLNRQQEEIKVRIQNVIRNSKAILGITGQAGTGKTLLLFDIAKTLSADDNVLIIHCGILNEGHERLNKILDNVDIIDAKHVKPEIINGYGYICVDEAQRIYSNDLKTILECFELNMVKTCIFSYDYTQVLSKSEQNRNIPEKLRCIAGFKEERITTKIRSNKEIYSFIRSMMRLTDRPKEKMEYRNIDIKYANSEEECDLLTKSYIRKGYTFLTFTPSRYYSSSLDHYAFFKNSHEVIGQEFDNVLILIDDNFRYSVEGDLEGREHPNPDYLFPKLFYQNISRAREKLCIVVHNNKDVFEKMLRIKEGCMIMPS